ncbi:hypothetical protein K440DRAFT_638836 [Wilcoxina mikolae CBS 423.85]|nr:hypothetical protein K440DRAFT_638836 [Wilcoxina mikolae CBS 423.85]
MFKRLLAWHNVFPPFLDYVHGFGFKLREEDENFGGYDRQFYFRQGNEFKEAMDYEFCYCLRYVAKHDREQQNPWSLRQTAVYQRYDSTSQSSKWILIQPSESLRVELAEYLESEVIMTGSAIIADCNAHTVHVMIFSSTERGWREYMNYLQAELNVLEKKAVYSSVKKHDPHDFTVAFSDAQGIQRLRGKLSKAILVLDSCMDVASGYEAHCEVLKDIYGPAVVGSAIFVQLECYRGRIKTHRRTASMLMDRSCDILQLLFQILKNRNDDTLVQMNKAMQQNSDVMTRMTIATNAGTEAIARLAQQGQSDSRFIKILTFAAMLYLPATLVVVTEAISSIPSLTIVNWMT